MRLDVQAFPSTLAAAVTSAYRRLSQRERWLLTAMVLIGFAFGAMSALQWRADQADRFAAALADLSAARRQRLALTRRGATAGDIAQLRAVDERSVSARNVWMARIGLEQRLQAAAVSAGLPSPQVKVAEGLEGTAAAPLLRAEISGPYASTALATLLRRLAGFPEPFVIDELQVTDPNTAQYKLALLFPIRLDQPFVAS